MAHNAKLGAKHHEVIGQQSFLGASVVNYSLNLGFGNQPSRIQFNLIEDAEHKQNPEGGVRYYNAVHEGYHPWKETVLPFNLDVVTHSDGHGGEPVDLPKGGDKPPYKGGRLGKPVLSMVTGTSSTDGTCAGATASNKADCEAASGTWTPADMPAYSYGDKFFVVGDGKDLYGNDIKRTMIGSPVWFNWYRYDKVDTVDPRCVPPSTFTGTCGEEGDIFLRDFGPRHPWYFNGVLTSVEVNNSSSSGKITSVIVEDPRSILAGTHVILGKFQGRTMTADGSLGTITSPYPERLYKHGFLGQYNVLNVYGFLEEVYGFGAVDKNEAGMIWWDDSGKNSWAEKDMSMTGPVKDSAGNDIGILEDYEQPPGTNIVDVLQWMLMGSAIAVHGEKNWVGWPSTREPGDGFFAGYRYHGPSTAAEGDPAQQRPTKPDGFRIGQERYGGLLYYGQNPLVNDIALIDPVKDYLYGPPTLNSTTGYGTLPTQINRFKVDLSELKDLHIDVHESGLLDSNFRIQADDISLLDLIQNICDYASADFFVELLPDIAPWPRGRTRMVCRDASNNEIVTDDCAGAGGTLTEELDTPVNGEGVTGVIKIRVVHRVKPPRANLLGNMIEDSKFDPEHVDDGEAPGIPLANSKHFKKWRGRLQSSKIGYEFADLPTGKMLMGAPRTRMVGVDPLGEDFLRTDVGDCIDENGVRVDLSSLSLLDRKKACEDKGVCYDPNNTADYVPDGSCDDQAAADRTGNGPAIAVYKSGNLPGGKTAGDPIDNKPDCQNTAIVSGVAPPGIPTGQPGQWCPYGFLGARQRTDYDGVEGPTSRDTHEGFFDVTNQMLEDEFGRNILGDQTLYEKRDYRNDFWANSIDNKPHLMRISGPNGVDDFRYTDPAGGGHWGWGSNGTGFAQAGVTRSTGGDPNDPATNEDLAIQPFFGDGKSDVAINPGYHLGGDGYADLIPAWGWHDRPDYCAVIAPHSLNLPDINDAARVCGGISSCKWDWEDPSDLSKGGKCRDAVPVKKKAVPKIGFFWDDEPHKDFNPPNPDFGYFDVDDPNLDDTWTIYHPPAGLMSVYDWVEPNCSKNIYAFPACRGVNTYKGQGYPTGKENFTRPRLKRATSCQKCKEINFVCRNILLDAEAASNGATGCPASGSTLTARDDCVNPDCHAPGAGGFPPLVEWIGGGCKEWEEEPTLGGDGEDVDDCFCDNDEAFVEGTFSAPSATPPDCSAGSTRFSHIPTFDESGFDNLQTIDRRSAGGAGSRLPDSAIIEIDMTDVYKETTPSPGNRCVYEHGEDFGGIRGFENRKHVYRATVTELRSAANSKEAWQDYIAQWGIKLQEDMGWKNNPHIGWFSTMFEGSKGASVGIPGTDGEKVTALEKLQTGGEEEHPSEPTKTIIPGETVGPEKSDTSATSLIAAPADRVNKLDAQLREEQITKDMDTIFNKIQDIAQNWYGKAYLMPLPFDPEDIEKHVRVASQNYDGIELESPKLDLDWDIATDAFVEMEFDKWKHGYTLKYPLSKNFVSNEGKMTGFFVFPQEYTGIEATDYWSATNRLGLEPQALSVNLNKIALNDRYITVPDNALNAGSTGRGKVFVKANIEQETYWLWEDEKCVIDYIAENHDDPSFKLNDAFDPVISNCVLKLKPYALLTMTDPVDHSDGLTDREKAMAGKAAVQYVFDALFDWDVTVEGSTVFSGVASDVLRAGLVPARFKPFGAAVPQVSNRHVWGPWSLGVVGDGGKVEVQKDNTFQPSNFGSIKDMDNAALSKVKADLVSQQITESGFVELTGGPEYFAGTPIGVDEDFGQYLVNIGAAGSITPYITDIAVDTNPSAGVTTKYTMRTWTPRLGKLEDWKLKQGVKQTRDLHKDSMEKNDIKYKTLMSKDPAVRFFSLYGTRLPGP